MKKFLTGIFIGTGIASASYLFAAGFNDVQIGAWVINSSNNAGTATTTGIRETQNTWPVQIATSTAFSREGLFNLTTYGSTTIQTPINTLNAFRIQNSASTTIFVVDTLNGSTTVTGPLLSSNSSNLGSSGSRWGTLFSNGVDTNQLTFTVATPGNANFGSNISVNGGTVNLGASPNTATTTLVANGSGQLTISASGTNQNVVLTPSGTGGTVISTLGTGAVSSSASGLLSSGTLSVANGGTGATTFTSNGVIYGNGTGAIQVTSQGVANSILTANAGAPSFSASPTIGTSITVPTVIGGTAVGSSLNLQSTSGVGTTDFIRFLVGNNGGTEAIRIIDNGNVGIGTTGPNAKLTITNNVISGFLDTYSKYQLMIHDGGTAGTSYGLGIKASNLIFNSGGGAYSFDSAGNATRMVIDTSGNVGIGTTSPGTLLGVHGAGLFSSNLTVGGTLTATSTVLLATTAGNVGIGTTSPTAPFTITNSASIPKVILDSAGNASGVQVRFLDPSTTYNWQIASHYNVTGAFEITPSTVVGGTTFSSPAVTILGTGNVGIGTTNPTFTQGNGGLHIGGVTSPAIRLTSTITGSGTWEIYADSAASGGLGFFERQNSITAMYLHESGNVGIGTTSPAKLLSSSGGDALISNTGTTTLNVDTPTAARGSCLELRAASSSDIYRLYIGTNPNNQDSLVVEKGACK